MLSLKARKHVTDGLIQQALDAGIRIVIVDELNPLEDQVPLDVVLQKIRNPGEYCTATGGGLASCATPPSPLPGGARPLPP